MVTVAKVDDPLDAFAVHGAGGTWGTLAAAIFSDPSYTNVAGLSHGNAGPLGAAVVGLLAVWGWCAGLSLLMFLGLKRLGLLRVDIQTELFGLDVLHSGGNKEQVSRQDEESATTNSRHRNSIGKRLWRMSVTPRSRWR